MNIDKYLYLKIGDQLKKAREQKGLSLDTLSELIGGIKTKSSLKRYEDGASRIEMDILKIICDKLDLDYLRVIQDARNEVSHNKYMIPVLGLVQAGIPITAVENIIEYEELDPKEYKRPEEYFGLKINGDSMEPKLFKDDTVIVHQQSSVENNDIAIVLINGDEATCKKVTFNNQGIILTSLNPSYPPMFYTLEQIEELPVTIVGKVVELRRKF